MAGIQNSLVLQYKWAPWPNFQMPEGGLGFIVGEKHRPYCPLRIPFFIYLFWGLRNHYLSNEKSLSWISVWDTYSSSSVQSLSRVWFFVTPWTKVRQASLSITNSRSPPKPTSIESVMPSNHLILCHPLLLLPSIFASIRSFPMSQLFAWGGQSIGVSVSTSVLPMNTQD